MVVSFFAQGIGIASQWMGEADRDRVAERPMRPEKLRI